MLLARPGATGISLTVQGYAPPPQSGSLVDAEAQQPMLVQIGANELAAKPLFGRPHHGDKLNDGGRTYTITEASAVYEGPAVIGWALVAVGGS